MRWPQFLLTLVNLAFAIYILLLNVLAKDDINSLTFLWTLVYLALALSISHLYMLYMSNKIDDWYDVESLRSITNLSIVALLVCAIALLTHLGLEYYYNKNVSQLFNNKVILKSTIIPLIGAILSSVVLFSSSVKFKKYVILCQQIDLQPRQRKNYRTAD